MQRTRPAQWAALAILSTLWITACASTARRTAGMTAAQFLHTVYQRYQPGGHPISPTDSRADLIYSHALLELMANDRRAVQGEAGVVDADPICACQGYGIRTVQITVQTRPQGRVWATAAFSNLGKHTTIGFDLIPAGSSWRIADIRESNVPSLRAALKAEIAATTVSR